MKHIEILDRSFRRLAFIDNDLEEGIHFVDDNLSTSIESGVYILEMEIPKDTPLTRHVTEGNYITFINRNNLRVLLTITKATDNRNTISIYCEDTSLNLINKVVGKIEEPAQPQNIDFYINHGLENTGWSIGFNESKKKKKLEFSGNETLLARIRNIAKEFEVEFYFEVDLENGKNPDFLLHVVESRIEGSKGFRISSDDSLDTIEREINLDNIVTKLIVRGASIKEEGTTSGSGSLITEDKKKIKQPTAVNFDSSKSSGATAISTSNWNRAWVDKFNMNAADPHYVTGAYIDNFLRTYYSDSPLIGHGSTIKEMSDYFGISVGAFIGVTAKETTFGRASCGGRYNFGCIMWTSSSPFPKKWANDRNWIDPPTIKSGIAAWFKLLRYNYIETGQVKYKDFLNKYSPAFENSQDTFKNLMWGALKSFGYDTTDTVKKSNYSNSNDNPLTLDLSANTGNNTSSNSMTTKHNEMIEKLIKWFQDRKGKVGYSMSSARSGPNYYDCSSAVYSALKYAGFKTKINYLGSTVSLWEDIGPDALMTEIPRNQARRGDLFLAGGRGAASAGANGHTGVFLDNNTIIHCNYADNGISVTPQQGRSGSPIYCFRLNNKFADVSIGGHISNMPTSSKTELAVQEALKQVGKPYVYGAVGPNSFDCSGLVIYAYKRAGFNIGHRATTYTIAQQKSPFKKISESEARRGDLVICVGGSHVAILLDKPSSGKGVVHAATPQLGVITQKSLMGPIGYYRVTD